MRLTWKRVSPLESQGLDDVMGAMLGTATSSRTFEPEIDVTASDDELTFLCDVPGIKEDDLEVTVHDHVLAIKGTRKFESKEGEQVMLGRAYGSFQREFQLPNDVDEDKLEAELANGVLSIKIPKLPKAKPRKIPIGRGKEPNALEE
jgi:HSP20 family protein